MTIFHKFVFSGTDIFHFYVNACYRRSSSAWFNVGTSSWYKLKLRIFRKIILFWTSIHALLESLYATVRGTNFSVCFSCRNAAQNRFSFHFMSECYFFSYQIFYCTTTVFVDTGLWKTKRKRFKISVNNCVLSTDRIEIHRSQPLVWPSDLLYVMLAGCDFRSDLSIINTQDCRKL